MSAWEPMFGTPITPWFRWFAWHPVRTLDRGWRWLMPVWRRCCKLHSYLPDGGAGEFWFQEVVTHPGDAS